MDPKKRILIFSLAYYPHIGGAEVAIKEITTRIPEIEFDMLTMRFEKADKPIEKIGNVNVYRLGSNSSYLNKILFVPRAALFALKLNKKNPYSVFWAMMTNMSFPISLMRLLGNKTPYILTLQDGDPFERVFERARIKIFMPLLKSGFRNASIIQTISTFLSKWPAKMGYKGKIEMIPNGVNVKEFSKEFSEEEKKEARKEIGKTLENAVLVSSSRLTKKNGLKDVIFALKYLPENITFVNFGQGEEKESLINLAKQIGVEKRVKLLNHPGDKLPLYFQISDIFIRPSLSEGQGISFLEGLASGLPIIGTPVGGIPDFLFDPDKNPEILPTGLFCEVNNPTSISKQVKRLIDDLKLRLEIVENGKMLVTKKYDWDLIARIMKNKVFDCF